MKQFYASEEEFEKDNAKVRNEIIKDQQNTTRSIVRKRRKTIIIFSIVVFLYLLFKFTIGSLHLSINLIDMVVPYTKGRLFEIKINDTIIGSNVTNNHSVPIIPTIFYLDNHSYHNYYTKDNNYYNVSKKDGKYILDIDNYACYYKDNNVETICELNKYQQISSNMTSKLKKDVKYTKLTIYDYKNNKNIYKGKFVKDITPYIAEDGTYLIQIIAKYPSVASTIEVFINMKEENEDKEEEIVDKMNIKINDKNYEVSLEKNNTVKDLIELLPLNITMQELNGNEKYYYLDKSITSAPMEIKEIKKGDIMLYNSNCLVLFYKDFTTHYPYTRIGHIDNPEGLEEILGDKDVNIKFIK